MGDTTVLELHIVEMAEIFNLVQVNWKKNVPNWSLGSICEFLIFKLRLSIVETLNSLFPDKHHCE